MADIGYARVSRREQNPASQEAELRAAGCTRVFVDHGESSRTQDRPEWVKCLDELEAGDTLWVRALDRLAGSELIAIETIRELGRRGVRLRSLTEPFLDIDTETPMGQAIIGIMAVLAQLRVDTIRDNTLRGLAYARSQGRVGGRRPVMTPDMVDAALEQRAAGKSIARIAAALKVSATSVSRVLERARTEEILAGVAASGPTVHRFPVPVFEPGLDDVDPLEGAIANCPTCLEPMEPHETFPKLWCPSCDTEPVG